MLIWDSLPSDKEQASDSKAAFFFKFVASHLQPFLDVYQTDRPMVPFLAEYLSQMVRGLMRCYIRSEGVHVSEKLSSLAKDKEVRLDFKGLELWFLTEKSVKEAAKNGLSERQIFVFRIEIIKFLDCGKENPK